MFFGGGGGYVVGTVFANNFLESLLLVYSFSATRQESLLSLGNHMAQSCQIEFLSYKQPSWRKYD